MTRKLHPCMICKMYVGFGMTYLWHLSSLFLYWSLFWSALDLVKIVHNRQVRCQDKSIHPRTFHKTISMLSAELVHWQQQGLFQTQERPKDSKNRGFEMELGSRDLCNWATRTWILIKNREFKMGLGKVSPLQLSFQALNLARPLQLACHGGWYHGRRHSWKSFLFNWSRYTDTPLKVLSTEKLI